MHREFFIQLGSSPNVTTYEVYLEFYKNIQSSQPPHNSWRLLLHVKPIYNSIRIVPHTIHNSYHYTWRTIKRNLLQNVQQTHILLSFNMWIRVHVFVGFNICFSKVPKFRSQKRIALLNQTETLRQPYHDQPTFNRCFKSNKQECGLSPFNRYTS